MTERTVEHGNFVLERNYDAPPRRVFAAWSTREALLRWAVPGEGWDQTIDRFDFRIGGGESSSFGPHGGATFMNEARYEDIVENARIVSSGSMTSDGKRLFAGLLTVEFYPAGDGCKLILTEQGAFLDGADLPENHRMGWGEMLDKLEGELKRNQ